MSSSSKLDKLFLEPEGSNRKTFQSDEKLPALPLPGLKQTLSKYLDSLRPFASKTEFQRSVRMVEAFELGIGAKLQEQLQKKAMSEKNWVEKWWLDFGYLQSRFPLLPYSNMVGSPPRIPGITYGSQEDQIINASHLCYHIVKYWDLLRKEKLKPDATAGGRVIFSMSQYKRLFNTLRLPGDKMDSLASYFKTAEEGSCPSNVVVMCRGRLFDIECFDTNREPLTPSAWEAKLRNIVRISSSSKEGQNIGILTCDSRSNWSNNRRHLLDISSKNRDTMKRIEECIFIVVLDEEEPESVDSLANYHLNGDYNNRWADKSLVLVVYKNGLYGTICDHTAFDGIASMTCLYYVHIALTETRGQLHSTGLQNLSTDVRELNFDLDMDLEGEIRRLNKDTILQRKKMVIWRMAFKNYGKNEIQRLKFHPDSYIQMALQFAYVRLHKKPAPCYETATTRAYYNGRTETVRSCTTECIEWINSMLDNKASVETRTKLLRQAVQRHDKLMAEARENAGCDRHLFGLYCAAIEGGMDVPELFSDPMFTKSGGGGNYILSTSCTGYSPLSGGVAPMCQDGYGIFYSILPDKLYFTISVNTESKETDLIKFFKSLSASLTDMRELVMNAMKMAKL